MKTEEMLRERLRLLRIILNRKDNFGKISFVTRSWNPVTGCYHNCTYCWARRLALTKLRHVKRYRHGFLPRLNLEEFRHTFKPGETIFVSDMGDLWGSWVPREWVMRVIKHVRRFPDTWFLFLTKNPLRYHEFLDVMPSNIVLGATIETNRDEYYAGTAGTPVSEAPPPTARFHAMKSLEWPLKYISIEPILDFDLEIFSSWIKEIDPIMIHVGYDNYGNKLPEPPLAKTLRLIEEASKYTIVLSATLRRAWNERLQVITRE